MTITIMTEISVQSPVTGDCLTTLISYIAVDIRFFVFKSQSSAFNGTDAISHLTKKVDIGVIKEWVSDTPELLRCCYPC